MKHLPLVLGCLFLPLLASGQQVSPSPTSQTGGKPEPVWYVRVELLVVDLPQERALTLLLDLRDEAKIDVAYAQIIEAIQHKEATLVGYPVVFTRSGAQASSETIDEFIYPTQFQPPTVPQNLNGVTPPTTAKDNAQLNLVGSPTNFEKRNVGVTLETEPNVLPGGDWIEVGMLPRNVRFEGYEWFEALKTPTLSSSVQQPKFYTTKMNESVLVRNGQRVLCGFHKLKTPDGQIELYLLQATTKRLPE